MTKEKFNELEILEQIEYINNKLMKGLILTKVAKDIGIGRSTITDRCKKINCSYSKGDNIYI